MAVRTVYPASGGPWPLIVFSHGMFSSNDMYMPVLEHWASHGYVILAPNHLDAKGAFRAQRNEDVERLIDSRAADLSLLLDALPQIEKSIPALRGQIAPQPYVAAGHSVGTYIAMLEAGLRVRNPKTGVVTAHPDPRIGAVVMSSDPGKMALMPEDLWRGIALPTFMTTGTADYGTSGKGRRATEYTSERLTGEGAPAGIRYRVLIEGGDHYYGGLIHRAPSDVKPDPEGLSIFLALSTTFLDAYAKKDVKALDYLRTVDVKAVTNGRATLTID
jgi:hypothetical protein